MKSSSFLTVTPIYLTDGPGLKKSGILIFLNNKVTHLSRRESPHIVVPAFQTSLSLGSGKWKFEKSIDFQNVDNQVFES